MIKQINVFRWNWLSLSIAFIGTYDKERPSEGALHAAKLLITHLQLEGEKNEKNYMIYKLKNALKNVKNRYSIKFHYNSPFLESLI